MMSDAGTEIATVAAGGNQQQHIAEQRQVMPHDEIAACISATAALCATVAGQEEPTSS